jgi:hypothetical protein
MKAIPSNAIQITVTDGPRPARLPHVRNAKEGM